MSRGAEPANLRKMSVSGAVEQDCCVTRSGIERPREWAKSRFLAELRRSRAIPSRKTRPSVANLHRSETRCRCPARDRPARGWAARPGRRADGPFPFRSALAVHPAKTPLRCGQSERTVGRETAQMDKSPVPPGGAKETGRADGRKLVGDWRAALRRHADALWRGRPSDDEDAAQLARTLGPLADDALKIVEAYALGGPTGRRIPRRNSAPGSISFSTASRLRSAGRPPGRPPPKLRRT